MIDVDQLMQEYGVPPPFPEEFASNEEYVRACDLWLVGFEAYKQGRLSAMEAAADPPVEDEAASGEGEPPHQTEEEAPVEAQEPEAVPDFIPVVEDGSETEDRYPVGSYIDEAGNVWSQEGELLSPGTTPAMEPVEALGEPAIDTTLLLVDLLEALTGEEGMGADMDSVQQVLDHPAMTTSFQDYTVTEGLLLLLLLGAFVAACARMLKEGFSWLR